MKGDYCFVIPCYNEEKNLNLLINELKKVNSIDKDINFILVDNGSVDNTRKFLNKEVKGLDFISLCEIDINQGMGYGIKEGLNKAIENDYKFVGWTHADLQIPFESILRIKKIMNENIDNYENIYIRGNRKNRDSKISIFFTIMMATYTSLLKKGFYWDITGLPALANKDLISEIIIGSPHGFGFDVHTFVHAKRKKAKIIRFNVYFKAREFGESSWDHGFLSKIKMSIYYFKVIFKI
tara:strand:- start:3274 stop:3987 length:714 start_codon:yes stop_codon:yes gene_type:complete